MDGIDFKEFRSLTGNFQIGYGAFSPEKKEIETLLKRVQEKVRMGFISRATGNFIEKTGRSIILNYEKTEEWLEPRLEQIYKTMQESQWN